MIRLRGFTLIELIVVMGILAILATIVVIAVNPGRQFAASRNAKRASDVRAIAQAINQHAADNNGQVYSSITTTPQTIGTGGLNLATVLVPTYLSAIPTDPQGGTATDTKYTVYLNSDNQVVVNATTSELGNYVDSSGVYSRAVGFDNINDYVSAGTYALSGTSFTFEAWVKPVTGGGALQTLLNDGGQASTGYLWSYRNANNLIYQYHDGTTWGSSVATNFFSGYDNTWMHVAIVADYSGKTVRFFRNGTLFSTTNIATAMTFPSGSRGKYFGVYAGAGMYYWPGSMDEIRLSNSLRYINNFTPEKRLNADSSTIALYHFDEGTGTTSADSSSNGYAATLVNGARWDKGPSL